MVSGTISVEVDASDKEEAKEKAPLQIEDMNFGELDNVEVETDEPFDFCECE